MAGGVRSADRGAGILGRQVQRQCRCSWLMRGPRPPKETRNLYGRLNKHADQSQSHMIELDHIRRALEARPGRPYDDPVARAAALAVILHEGLGGVAALFIKRAARPGDRWSGQMAFPGGHHQAADADLRSTAIREAREETGIDLSRAERLGTLDDVKPLSLDAPPIVVRPFVFAVLRCPSLVVSSDEVQRAFWVPISALLDPPARTQVTMSIRGVPQSITAYRAEGEIIWGMTERILRSLLQLISG